MLSAELERLTAHLDALNRPVVALMLSGADEERVSSILGEAVPQSVAEWFRWCNGIGHQDGQFQDDVNTIPGYNPLSIEEAVQLRGDYEGDSVLGSHWVPLLGNPGGDLYAAVWTPGSEAVVAGVLVGEPTEIEFQSVEHMVVVFNRCFESGAFFVNEEGRLVMAPEHYEEVYAQTPEQ
jgi:hypothetical protein